MAALPSFLRGGRAGTGTVQTGRVTSFSPEFLAQPGQNPTGGDDARARLARLTGGYGNANLIPAIGGAPGQPAPAPNPLAAPAAPPAPGADMQFPYYPETDANPVQHANFSVPTQMSDFTQWLNNVMGQQFPYAGAGTGGGNQGFGALIPGPTT